MCALLEARVFCEGALLVGGGEEADVGASGAISSTGPPLCGRSSLDVIPRLNFVFVLLELLGTGATISLEGDCGCGSFAEAVGFGLSSPVTLFRSDCRFVLAESLVGSFGEPIDSGARVPNAESSAALLGFGEVTSKVSGAASLLRDGGRSVLRLESLDAEVELILLFRESKIESPSNALPPFDNAKNACPRDV